MKKRERERGGRRKDNSTAPCRFVPSSLLRSPDNESHDLLAAEDRGSRVTPIETRLIILGSAVKS